MRQRLDKKYRFASVEQENQGSGWLTTFNDLITLLMVFFVLLFSMSNLDVGKIQTWQKSLQSAFGVLKEGNMTSISLKQPYKIYDKDKKVLEKKKLDDAVIIKKLIKALNAEAGIKAIDTKKGTLITLENAALFRLGKAGVNNKEAFPVLDKISNLMKKIPNHIRVEGHTDNLQIIYSEKFPSNWELSVNRSVNVVKYFIEKGNISPSRLSAVGYGESKPIFPNDSIEHRAMNRRVEILLVMEDKK